jgi:uncharacterized membrane protein YphA (DoxX/SURF4 family)
MRDLSSVVRRPSSSCGLWSVVCGLFVILPLMRLQSLFTWVLRILAAVIMLQTLYFKFTDHPQSVQLFTTLGMEPWGRYGTGIAELIASILILFPRTCWIGALLGLGLMAGAIYFHLTKLGIYVDGDPVLFIYAAVVFICCGILLFIHRSQILHLIRRT